MKVFLAAGEYVSYPQMSASQNPISGHLEVEITEEEWELYMSAHAIFNTVETIFYQKYKEAGGTV